MAREDTPDRRPLLYGIAALLILCAALFLFWPRGPKNELSTMTLTPPGTENSLQAGQVSPEGATPAEGESSSMSPEDTPAESLSQAPQKPSSTQLQATELHASTSSQTTPVHAASTEMAPTTRSSGSTSPNTGAGLVQPGPSGRYLINLGSFSSHSNAQRRVDELRQNGVPADVAQGTKPDGTPLYRVRIAYFEGHSLAKAYGEDLQRRLGLKYWISER